MADYPMSTEAMGGTADRHAICTRADDLCRARRISKALYLRSSQRLSSARRLLGLLWRRHRAP
jgi:hypothetical protein